jgi:hypothetical protein
MSMKIRQEKKSGEIEEIRLAGKPGFEPRFHDPESCVLPLDDFPAGVKIILDFHAFFNRQFWELNPRAG